ncbi:hypothetical protein [Brachybacterium sp. EE-P12]|uniref:hypothetical protein n=1 Tax=Brachybacterium sp. EE-P12 TaxID=2306299 RepID=UPI000F07A486|nr:hypothetical protein [Brachybacterium sp. EE-P12]
MSTITSLTHHPPTITLPSLLEAADERELDRRLHRVLARLRALRRARRDRLRGHARQEHELLMLRALDGAGLTRLR